MVYCSKDEWAKKEGYASWAVYDKEYPTEAGLDDMLEDMSGLMDDEMGNTTGTEISSTTYAKILRNICGRGISLMIDEEEGRNRGENTMTYVPKDYLHERDRDRLHRIGVLLGYKLVGNIG